MSTAQEKRVLLSNPVVECAGSPFGHHEFTRFIQVTCEDTHDRVVLRCLYCDEEDERAESCGHRKYEPRSSAVEDWKTW